MHAPMAKAKKSTPAHPPVTHDAEETSGRMPTLTIAAPQQLLDALDAYAKHLSERRLGMVVSRGQVVREILTEALAAWREKGSTK